MSRNKVLRPLSRIEFQKLQLEWSIWMTNDSHIAYNSSDFSVADLADRNVSRSNFEK